MFSNQQDREGDEYDGMDESQCTVFQALIFRTKNALLAICPTDYETAGVLVDDVYIFIPTIRVTTHVFIISLGATRSIG